MVSALSCCHDIARYRHQRPFYVVPGSWSIDAPRRTRSRCSPPSILLGRDFLRFSKIKDTQSFHERVDTVPLFQRVKLSRRTARCLRGQLLGLVFVLPAEVGGGANLVIVAVVANNGYYSDNTLIIRCFRINRTSAGSSRFSNAFACCSRVARIRARDERFWCRSREHVGVVVGGRSVIAGQTVGLKSKPNCRYKAQTGVNLAPVHSLTAT